MLRKTIIILIEIGLLCAILIIGAHIWYNNPKHCISCHEIEKYYKSWRKSTHSSVRCLACHQENNIKGIIETNIKGIFRVVLHFTHMDEDYEIKTRVFKERCLQCHPQIRKKFRVGSMADLSDTHSIHINMSYHCTDCHKASVHPESPGQNGMPTMVTCMTCHIKEQAPATCETCHIDVERHKTTINRFGGLLLQEQGACFTCHVLLSPYDHRIDHEKAISNVGGWQENTMVCKKCHPQSYIDTKSTVHVRLKSKVNVQGVTGEHGLITRFSPYWSSYAVDNWADLLQPDNVSTGCGKCHVGGIKTNEIPSSEIDCLICHSQTYDMNKRVVIQDGDIFKWVHDTSEAAAYSVGPAVLKNCKRCHEDYMAFYRGTPFTPQQDVHAVIGMECTQCHTIIHHKIARGNYVTDIWANDLPSVAHGCIQCHINKRHKNKRINQHLKKLSCEACHVRTVAGLSMIDWTNPQRNDKNVLYSPYKEEVDAIKPYLTWFNGNVEATTKPVGSRKDSKSKLYPFKLIQSFVPVDPETQKPLPLNLSVYYQTGNVTEAVRVAMEQRNEPWNRHWTRQAYPPDGIYVQVNHAVNSPGRSCNECHGPDGIIDPQSLGISQEEWGKENQALNDREPFFWF